MKKLKKLFRRSFDKVARPGELKEAFQALKFWELVMVVFVFIIILISVFTMTSKLIKETTVEYASYGGTLKEGVVGDVNIINPLLAVRDEDRDIVSLVFSGLTRKDGDTYVNDLASEVIRSADGKTFTVKIKPDLEFHNGDTLNADDILFTISLIKDPRVKSPLKVLWDSVNVTKQDELTVVFNLKQPYGFFEDMLTVGILSEDIFKEISREEFPTLKEHQNPIGAGPFRFVNKNTKDNKTKSITLKSFKKYEQRPFINKLRIKFYDDEDALVKDFRKGRLDIASGVSAENSQNESKVFSTNLNRTFAIFVNRSRNSYDPKTIEALSLIIPREKIVEESLFGYGETLYGPYSTQDVNNGPELKERVEKALGLIEQSGWKHSEDGTYAKTENGSTRLLSVSITSPDTKELRSIGSKIVEAYRDVGIQTNITYINPNIFTEEIIRSRNFDFVLFGQVIHTPANLYAFWHSSQRNDPGLNISGYSNKSVDTKLESILRENNLDKQKTIIDQVNTAIRNDMGALFIFSPKYIILSKDNIDLDLPETISRPEDRYQKIMSWYLEKERVFKFLK